MAEQVSYLIFDAESVADKELIAKVRYSEQDLSAEEAFEKYQAELLAERGTTFVPFTFQVPTSVVIGKVDAKFQLLDVVSLDEPEFRSHVMTAHFWKGWDLYRRPTWVTFNGRTFDIPLMELAAFRYGISLQKWFLSDGYKSPRHRFSMESHLDLQELLTNFGAVRFNGGLNLAAQLLGKPGKMEMTGDQVQQQFDDGDLQSISDYCRCDVLDTYFVFLRSMVLIGRLTLEKELKLVAETKQWIEKHVDQCAAYGDYLDQWDDWHDPWEAEELVS